MRRSLRRVVRFIAGLRIKKIKMTKGTLYQIHLQFEAWKQNGSVALVWCNKEKMNEFYNQNRDYISALVDKINKLHEKYFVIVDNKIQQTPKREPMFKHGVSPIDFEKEQEELFSAEVSQIMLVKK